MHAPLALLCLRLVLFHDDLYVEKKRVLGVHFFLFKKRQGNCDLWYIHFLCFCKGCPSMLFQRVHNNNKTRNPQSNFMVGLALWTHCLVRGPMHCHHHAGISNQWPKGRTEHAAYRIVDHSYAYSVYSISKWSICKTSILQLSTSFPS